MQWHPSPPRGLFGTTAPTANLALLFAALRLRVNLNPPALLAPLCGQSRLCYTAGFAFRIRFIHLTVSASSGPLRCSRKAMRAAAFARVTFLDDPVCDGCGLAMAYATAERCAACLAKPKAFQRARAACVYDEHSRELPLG